MIESWLDIVIRQMIFYSLPVLISTTAVVMLEARFTAQTLPHPFYPIAWKATWWPLLVSIALHHGVIIALPQPLGYTLRAATIRALGHALCCLIGFALYQWMLHHPPPVGLPPLHQWWAKVLMYFNLCMLLLHTIPMPGMVCGEWLHQRGYLAHWWYECLRYYAPLLWLVIAALPMLDMLWGHFLIYPLYQQLATLATV